MAGRYGRVGDGRQSDGGVHGDGPYGEGSYGEGSYGEFGAAGGYPAARLRLLHGGTTGADRRSALARLTDGWLARLLGPERPGLALVAVGGYGRGALSPRSDLDLLLLHHADAASEEVAAAADRVWYPVWDLGLALDHSVRTPAQALTAAAADLKVQLGLLDARHVAGDRALTDALRTEALAQWRAQAPRRLPELSELTRERARVHGELSFLLEPDLKEARGGLRDVTALRAVAASWLADAPRAGLAEAHGALLDVRDALHLATGRATDRLALEDRDAVAVRLGLPGGDALLRHVYEQGRALAYACDVTWREVERVLRSRHVARGGTVAGARSVAGAGTWAGNGTGNGTGGSTSGGLRRGGRAERTPLAEGVVQHEGEAALARSARPDRDPVLPLRAAAAAARAGLALAPPAVRRMAAASVAPGARALPEPWPPEAREQLVTLLGAGSGTVPVWEALEAEGLVSRLLPEWERVRCRPQRNPVHRWTVDRHLVETAVRAAALTRRVHRPDLLLVAALLHDIGKGRPGDHAARGAALARDIAARIGFGAADTETVATLVRHHLLLVETATRRDPDDPGTVRSVAEVVGDQGTLELLHALTEADALATGPAAWSAWRAALVAGLVERVARVLAGADAAPRPAHRRPSAEAERLAHSALRTGSPQLALRARPESPPHGGDGEAGEGAGEEAGPETAEAAAHTAPIGVELSVAVPGPAADAAAARGVGVLPAVAGVLALHRLAVRTAHLHRLRPHGRADAQVLLLDWRVAAAYGAPPEAGRLRADLARALGGGLDLAARLAERESAQRGRRRSAAASAPPPRVTHELAGSELATVLEVRAPDAPGLLYRVGRALDRSGALVRSAYVSTLGADAVDAFYVTGRCGGPLPDAEAAALARSLERELAGS